MANMLEDKKQNDTKGSPNVLGLLEAVFLLLQFP